MPTIGDVQLTATNDSSYLERNGYLVADGSAVSRTTYAQLFNLVATIYGVGDGSTTFNLPDLRTQGMFGDVSDGAYAVYSGVLQTVAGNAPSTFFTDLLAP